MSNVRGIDSGTGSPGDRNEFIEIYNNSDSSIVITNYSIGDGDATDKIRVWNDSLGIPAYNVRISDSTLPPHHFAVILDPEYCLSEYENQSYFMPYKFGDSCLLVTVGNTTIGNGLSGSDPIYLYDSNLIIIDTYGTPFDTTDDIPRDPGDGISMEKIYLNGQDKANNWKPSISASGCTPGNYNSVSENNLVKIDFLYNIDNDTTTMNFYVTNDLSVDLRNTNVILKLYRFESNGDMQEIDSSIIFSGDPEYSVFSINYKIHLDLTKTYKIKLILKNSLISSIHEFWIKNEINLIPPVEINEIMEHNYISPDWVEIKNISNDTIKFNSSCLICGKDTNYLSSFSVPPGEYKVIVHDTTAFFRKYSRNTKIMITQNALNIIAGDTLSFTASGCLLERVCISRELHFGRDTSIERIRNSIPATSNDNWSFSRDASGATPGRKNSISDAQMNYDVNAILLSPNPFNYHRDNAIYVKFPKNCHTIKFVRIYKTDGYRISDIQISNPYIKELIWKPESNNGKMLSTGLYIAIFKYTDLNGKGHYAKMPFAVKR